MEEGSGLISEIPGKSDAGYLGGKKKEGENEEKEGEKEEEKERNGVLRVRFSGYNVEMMDLLYYFPKFKKVPYFMLTSKGYKLFIPFELGQKLSKNPEIWRKVQFNLGGDAFRTHSINVPIFGLLPRTEEEVFAGVRSRSALLISKKDFRAINDDRRVKSKRTIISYATNLDGSRIFDIDFRVLHPSTIKLFNHISSLQHKISLRSRNIWCLKLFFSHFDIELDLKTLEKFTFVKSKGNSTKYIKCLMKICSVILRKCRKKSRTLPSKPNVASKDKEAHVAAIQNISSLSSSKDHLKFTCPKCLIVKQDRASFLEHMTLIEYKRILADKLSSYDIVTKRCPFEGCEKSVDPGEKDLKYHLGVDHEHSFDIFRDEMSKKIKTCVVKDNFADNSALSPMNGPMKESGKRSREKKKRMITMDIKHEIIEKHERGARVSDLACEYKRSSSTICTILKHKEVIKKLNPSKGVTINHPSRTNMHDEMEKLLTLWIQEKQLAGDIITEGIICEKALNIFSDLKASSERKSLRKEPPLLMGRAAAPFMASRGWFKKFKKRSEIHLVVRPKEAACLDAAKKFVEYFNHLIAEEGYITHQVFNCDETALFWKEMPKREFPSKEKNMLPDYKSRKERLTLALCANASGDLKIKPLLIYHTDHPHAFEIHKVDESKLQVMWRANAKAWVTHKFFIDWINEVFGPSVKKYLIVKRLPLKCLLLLDNSPGHPPELEEKILEEFNFVKVLYIPSSMAPFLQPMDRQVISNFKKLYTKYMFKKCFDVINATNLTPQEFLKDHFDIVNSLTGIDKAWQSVTKSTIISAWKKLWPEAIRERDFKGFKPQQETDKIVLYEIISIGKSMGLEVNEDSLNDLVSERSVDLTTEELQEIKMKKDTELTPETQTVQHIELLPEIPTIQHIEIKQEIFEEDENKLELNISTEEIKDILAKWQEVSDFIERTHPDKLSCIRARALYNDTCVQHFRNILRRRQIQSSLDYFSRKRGASDKSESEAKKKK